ncbi:MAG: GntR family transcriptional regulator [Herminiimonas sp.]|nr:GntR family transcriptional regulator [Herminiimonas sp.]
MAKSGMRYADQAYHMLKDALLSGEYRAGERLAVDSIAKTIGSSRQPVMDAFRRLEGEGLLNVIPQVGTIVASVSPADVKDFFRFLAQIEGYFARLAAERASEAEGRELKKIAADYFDVAPSGESDQAVARRYRLHNRAFHSQIHQMARAPLVHQVAVSLWDKADFYLNTMLAILPFVEREREGVNEHMLIAEAIAEKDGEAAYNATVPHILLFAEAINA